MRKEQRSMLVLAIITALIATALFLPGLVSAGDLEPPPEAVDEEGQPVSTMQMVKSMAALPTGFVLWEDNTRFAVSDEGTPENSSDDVVLDRATGLMWARDANLDGPKTWQDAMDYCDGLELGRSLTLAVDWRLPSIEELTSLALPVKAGNPSPALPDGHPFVNVQSSYYWSSTTYEKATYYAWGVGMPYGGVGCNDKTGSYYVWPVRAGN